MCKNKSLILTLILCAVYQVNWAQQVNYDESQVPDYTLPSLLVTNDGKKVKSTAAWEENRRGEILELLETQVYGKEQNHDIQVSFYVKELDYFALNELAVRKQIAITFEAEDKSLEATILLYLPKSADGPVPVFLGYNFYGNHTIIPDAEVILTKSWVRNNVQFGIENNQASELSRGVRTNRWPVRYILSRGYGLATMYYGDIEPDFPGGFKQGIRTFTEDIPEFDEWGAIGVWAWGLTRALDYFERDNDVNHQKVIVIGHSRLGKAALWAGAKDQRFAMVISNDSGCGGAALSMRRFGETVAAINTRFPHWFCANFNRYNENENALPVDQHMLLALIAPRPLYVASAEQDRWADPKGEFLSAKYASPVYQLYEREGITAEEMPAINQPLHSGHIGYHIRTGEHDLTYFDWKQFLDFADKKLK